MKVSEVTLEDGKACAAVINALNLAKFDGLTGKDMETLVAAKKWLIAVATQMASELKSKKTPAPAPTAPMKVKKIGSVRKGR